MARNSVKRMSGRMTWCVLAAAVAAPAGMAMAKPITIKNDRLTVTYDDAANKLSVKGPGGWELNAVELAPEIVGRGKVTAKQVDHKDDLGAAQAIEVQSEGGSQRVWVYPDQPFMFTRATWKNGSGETVLVKHVEPLKAQVKTGASSADGLKLFASNGLNDAAKEMTSYVFLSVVDPKSSAGLVGGWLTHEVGSGIVTGNAQRIVAGTDYGQLRIPAGKSAEGETFAVGFFDDAHDGLEQMADATAKLNHIKLPEPMNGYSTWYHAHALDEKRMAELAQFCDQNHLKDYGLGFLQIDDQWQVSRRDFTTHRTGEKANYPSGMKQTAQAISRHGFVPGLWLTPFGWDSKIPTQQRDWFVKKQDGSVYDVKWAGDCLDMSNPQAREFLSGVIHTMTDEWGYKLLKIDGLWSGMACSILYPKPDYRDDNLGDAVFYDKSKTNEQVYRDGLRLVREAAGKDTFILGCNIAQNMRTLGGSIGLVDSMRIGPDIGASWDRVVRCAQPAIRLYFLNGRVWWNDPDCLMLREPLTLEEGRAWGSMIALSGQLHLVSEWLPGLPAERLDVWKRTVPNHKRPARPVDLFERGDGARVWHMTWGEGDDRRDVVGLFNWDAPKSASTKPTAGAVQEEPTGPTNAKVKESTGPASIKVDLKRAGVPVADGAEYVAYDFWANQPVEFKDGQEFQVAPGSCKVLAIQKKLDRPQVLSTSRHVTQGAVDLADVKWDAATRTLRGKSRVVTGDPYELRIRPAGLQATAANVAGGGNARAALTQDGEIVRVTVNSPQTGEVEWEVKFAKAAASAE